MVMTVTYRPSRSDVAGMWAFIVAGAVIAVWAIVASVLRIIHVAPNRDVRVPAVFAGTAAEAPIGAGGATVEVALDRADLIVPALPGASLAALIIQQVLAAATIVIVVLCLILLCWAVMRGRVFGRRNTVLVTVAGVTGLIGFAAVPFLGNMAANGAFARVSEGDFNNVVMSVDPLPFLFLAFVSAMAGVVFALGDRLRRDTEGLV